MRYSVLQTPSGSRKLLLPLRFLLAATSVACFSCNPSTPGKPTPTGAAAQIVQQQDDKEAEKPDKVPDKAAPARRLRFWDMNNHDEAIEQTSQMIRDDPKDARAYRWRARAYWYKGKYAKSIADADRAIALKPKDGEAYFIRANALASSDQPERALEDYTRSLEIAPNIPTVLLNRADVYHHLKQHDKAIEDYDAALRLEPKMVGVYINRANLHEDMKQYDKAIKDFEAALRLAPDDHGPYTGLAWLLATCPKAEVRDGRKAVQYARKACELSAWNDANDLENLAAAYAETGQFQEAVKWQKKALQRTDRFTKVGLEGARQRLELYQNGKPCRDIDFPAVTEKR